VCDAKEGSASLSSVRGALDQPDRLSNSSSDGTALQ
jgi:hypothetical protein